MNNTFNFWLMPLQKFVFLSEFLQAVSFTAISSNFSVSHQLTVLLKGFFPICDSTHIHDVIFLPSYYVALVQRSVFQLCCAVFLILSWSLIVLSPPPRCSPQTYQTFFFSLEHTKLIPQIRNLSLCLKDFAHRFSNILLLSCHRYELKYHLPREASPVCPVHSNFLSHRSLSFQPLLVAKYHLSFSKVILFCSFLFFLYLTPLSRMEAP